MSKKITEMRINKEVQAMEREPIPCVLVQRDAHLTFHFCFYDLQNEFQGGFYHGVLHLADDYPFSPPKIYFLTNNGRFEVGKSICTTFTHYHKETWSSSWNIRTILTAMISFMYSNERGIGGLFETTENRLALAARSLQQNLKCEKFVQLFREKISALGPTMADRVADLLADIERAKRRKHNRSETTHADDPLDLPELPEKEEAVEVKEGEAKGQNAVVIYQAEESEGRKREITDRDPELADEIAQMEIFSKKLKMDYLETEREELRPLERQKTVQDNQNM